MMKKSLFLLGYLMLSLLMLDAQNRVPAKIVDSGELYSTYNLASSTSDQTEIKRQVGAISITEIIKYANEEYWPLGISSLSQRDRNRAQISNYKVYRIATFGDDKSLLLIPADENGHMPASMRPERNIYFIIGNGGIQTTGGSSYSSNQNNATSNAATGSKIKVKIVESGELYSTYGLAGEAADKEEIRTQVGSFLLNDIVRYSEESNWPTGIATLDARNENRPKINNYTAYRIATFAGDKAVLLIPANENSHMPSSMRPSRDIYFIIGASAVEEVYGSYSSSGSGSGGVRVKITDSGELYSTYGLANEADDKEEIKAQVGATMLNDIVRYSEESNWPAGIATLEARDANRPKINNYTAYQVATFGDKVVLRIPASENSHMPSNMRPTRDIYFIIGSEGVEGGGGYTSTSNTQTTNTPAVSANVIPDRAPMHLGNITLYAAKLTDPWQLMSTQELKKEPAFLRGVAALTSDEIDYVATHAVESAWPEGIATFSARDAGNRDKMVNYNVYTLCKFTSTSGSEMVVLYVPASENGHMPANLRPDVDIFITLLKSGVATR